MAADNPLTGHLQELSTRIQERLPHCKNEYQTRVSLINPTLACLGFDPQDPSLVRVEHTVNRGKVDYALLVDEQPIIFVEAKAANGGLNVAHQLKQIREYAELESSVRFVALTNGVKWLWFAKKPDKWGQLRIESEHFWEIDFKKDINVQLEFLSALRYPCDPDRMIRIARFPQYANTITNALLAATDRLDTGFSNYLIGILDLPRNSQNRELVSQVWQLVKSNLRKETVHSSRLPSPETNRRRAVQNKRPTVVPRQISSTPKSSGVLVQSQITLKTSDGSITLEKFDTPRAWKSQSAEVWTVEKSFRNTVVAVAKYLSEVDERGPDLYWRDVWRLVERREKGFARLLVSHEKLHDPNFRPDYRSNSVPIWDNLYLFLYKNAIQQQQNLERLASVVQLREQRCKLEDLVTVWLPGRGTRSERRARLQES